LATSIYSTFGIEQRFGFNKTTPAVFVADLLKSAALGVALGWPLLTAALWLMRHGGALWWVWLWAGWMAFSLLLVWIYPTLIAPLFNKFTPLPDGPVKQRIEALLERVGFSSDGLFVMDGSKRSAHANAYFTGWGSKKRIVLFDTLCSMLQPSEIEAVLAHEVGHSKKRHVWSRLAVSGATSLAGLGVLALVIKKEWFFSGLGVSEMSYDTGLLLFLWVAPLFSFPLTPLWSAWSRKHEYEADSYAAEHAEAAALVSALVRMYEKNAATLTPDPLHSAYYDSHPPAALRIARLERAG
jgi:STE24 endopeptidase